MEIKRCFPIENLAAAVMARAVLDGFAARTLVGLDPPAAYRIAKKLGVRSEHIKHLWAGRAERVGLTALKKIAARFGCELGTQHGVLVVVPTDRDLPVMPEMTGSTISPMPSALLDRARAFNEAQAGRGEQAGRAQFSHNMRGAV